MSNHHHHDLMMAAAVANEGGASAMVSDGSILVDTFTSIATWTPSASEYPSGISQAATYDGLSVLQQKFTSYHADNLAWLQKDLFATPTPRLTISVRMQTVNNVAYSADTTYAQQIVAIGGATRKIASLGIYTDAVRNRGGAVNYAATIPNGAWFWFTMDVKNINLSDPANIESDLYINDTKIAENVKVFNVATTDPDGLVALVAIDRVNSAPFLEVYRDQIKIGTDLVAA